MPWISFLVGPACFAGFAALAMSMDRHHREAAGAPCPTALRRRLRRLGFALLLSAATAAIAGRGVGIVAGVLSSSLAAGAVVGVLGLRPKLLARLAARLGPGSPRSG